MLKYFRRHARSWIVKVLYGGIVAVFALWGVGINLGGRHREVVVTVDGQEITRQEVEETRQRLLDQYRRVIQGSLSPETLASIGQQALDQVIDRTLLRAEAERLGLEVTDEEMQDAILKIPGVRNRQGAFEPGVFEAALRQAGLTPADFADAVLVQKLEDTLTETVPVTESEAWQQFVLDHEQVSLWHVQVRVAEFEDEVTPTDQELRAYYEAHAEELREPERATIAVLRYEPAKFEKDVTLTPEDIQEFYILERETRFMEPERTRVRQIFFRYPAGADEEARSAVRSRAGEVLAALRDGADFAALARKHSDDSASAANGGDLGWLEGTSGRGTAFDIEMLTLQPGELSDLVDSPEGIYIVRVEERQAARARPLEAARDEIEHELRKQKAAELARQAAEADRERALAGTALADLARERGIQLLKPSPFARGESINELPGGSRLVNASFSLEPDELSPVLDIEGSSVFFRLVERAEGQVPELAEVRERVARKVRQEKAAEAAKAAAEALRRAAEATDLVTAAKAAGREALSTDAFTRTAVSVPGIGPAAELKTAAFNLSADSPVAGPFRVGGSFTVIALKERQAADREQFASEREKIEERLRAGMRQAILRRHLQLLKSRAEIVTYPERLAGIPGV